MKPGDKVTWFTQHSSYEALKEDFGDGPFTILGVEDGAPEHGQWVSITRDSDGLAWVDHNNQWESPKCEDPKLHKAIPPTFHSQWFVHLNPEQMG